MAVQKALAAGADATTPDANVPDQDVDETGADAIAPAEAESVVRLYFVRLPRPQLDDTLLKKLQGDFLAHVADIKVINGRLAAKRVSPTHARG